MQEGKSPRSALSLVARDQPIPAKVFETGKLTAKNYSISESGTTDYIESTEKKELSTDQSENVPPLQDSTESSTENTSTTDDKAPEN